MVTFELSTLAIFIYGTIAVAVIGYVIERLLTWHSSKIITIQKRSDEFIERSNNYYIPLASVVGEIEGETDLDFKVRPKILFFKLAKYLSLYVRFLDVGVGFTFPKLTQEFKVTACFTTFSSAINLLIFNDDRVAIERVIKYYNKKPDLLSFIKDIENLDEYNAFKSICNNSEIKKKLYTYSGEFRKSILDGVTEEYRVWYKFEFRKRHTEKNIKKNEEDEKKNIIELYKDIYNKKSR